MRKPATFISGARRAPATTVGNVEDEKDGMDAKLIVNAYI